MRRAIAGSILLLIWLVLVELYAGAPTCIDVNKTLKVKEVCGKVTNPLNDPVVRELLPAGSEVLSRALTDDRGDFMLPNVPKGQYTIRVRSAGSGSVAQQFMVTRSNRSTRCNKPMQVRLHLGSGCSSVSK